MKTHVNLKRMNTENLNIRSEDIDEILRGEISAAEAYNQVIGKVKTDPEVKRLKEFNADHRDAVLYWRKQARLNGDIPEAESSIWGTAVEAFVGTSKLLGQKSALKALKTGEEHGRTNYQKMLKSNELSPDQKNKIREVFIPKQNNHIESLSFLIRNQ